MENYVWEFTNKRKLTAAEFVRYFEKKVWKTIRQYGLLPENRAIKLKKSRKLNCVVLKYILEKKFEVRIVDKGENFSCEDMTEISEDIFKNILKGKFGGKKPADKKARPFYLLKQEEVELYAKLKNLKGEKRKKDEKIEELFERFKDKNPDLENNIIKAFEQLNS